MSTYAAFRRSPVQPQAALQVQTITIPAPTRGIIQDENQTFMQPGAAVVLENWKPTLQGLSLRAGCDRWCELPETTPVISAFEYASGINERMFAANATKVYDVTTSIPVAIATGRTSGNYAAAQLANQGGDWLIAVNDAGDPPLRYDGTTWESMGVGYVPPGGKPSAIDVDLTDYPDAGVVDGQNLVHVCKYRNRLFFIERHSMNAWYLPLNAVGGMLEQIPLSGAANEGGYLLFAAVWSLDAGDGTDDKLVFATNKGELLIFTGSDPSAAANWRQEGRYKIPPPLGMNATVLIGGDLLIATLGGIVPTSAAITKGPAELELAAITRKIRLTWRETAIARREHPWTMCDWPDYGGMFVATPGTDASESKTCLVVNTSSVAWARFTWDCSCFIRMGARMFFGTRDGLIMQADQTGYDDGLPYTATMVGGWEMFSAPSQTCTWVQARASFSARPNQPFQPQLSAATDYVVTLPTPPHAGPDPGPLDLWDEGLWGDAVWDGAPPPAASVRNTGWVSIGMTGYSHAPVLMVTVGQASKPYVDLISIAATFNRMGVTV